MRPPLRNGNVHVQARSSQTWLSRPLRLERRRIRLADILAGGLIALSALAVLLVIVALGLGSAWLIIVIVQDFARRFG